MQTLAKKDGNLQFKERFLHIISPDHSKKLIFYSEYLGDSS